MDETRFKHIGVQVPEELHYKFKLMSAEKRTKMTDLVVPLIRKLVAEWEQEKSNTEGDNDDD